MLSCRIPECYSSELLQEINGNVLREWVGGSLVYGNAASEVNGRVPWHIDGLTTEISSMTVMIDLLTSSGT